MEPALITIINIELLNIYRICTVYLSPFAALRSSAKVVVCAGVNFPEGRKLRVAVVGGGPAGASCADQLAKEP